MNFDNMLSEGSHTQRSGTVLLHICEISGKVPVVQAESRAVVAGGWREKETRNNCYWLRGFPLGWWKCYGTDDGHGYTDCDCAKCQ